MTDEQELIRLLREDVVACGSQRECAKAAGVSPQFLHDVLAGRRSIGEVLVKYLGYKKVVTYERE